MDESGLERVGRGVVVVALAMAIVAWPAVARGSVEVSAAAAENGVYGLRAEVKPGCTGAQSVVIVDPVASDTTAQACKEVVVAAEVLGGAKLDAVGGERVSFGSGFRVDSGGELVAGVTGLWDPGYVIDETPAALSAAKVGWSVRFDGIDQPAGSDLVVLRVESQGGARGWVRYSAGALGGVLDVEVKDESGGIQATPQMWVGPGWHRLEVEWSAGSAIGATGSVKLLVDGAVVGDLSNLALATATVDRVSIGVVEASAPGGFVDVDDYEIWAE